jgi:Tfp pilus assembly PilM family ATPase
LAKHDDIHSTEKLLNLIRHDSVSEISHDKNPAHSEPKKSRMVAPVSFKKRMTIGVDIGHTYIRLAKISPSDKSPEILDHLHVPVKFNIKASDPKFQTILKSTLDQFCEGSSQYDIWGAIQSANVETRSIRIPKVPRTQIANAVFWTFTKKIAFNEHEELLDFEVIGEVTEGGINKIEAMAFKAPKAEIDQIKTAFENIGYPLKGISIVPFALQNLFRSGAIDHSEKDTCCLFVGRDWSRIAIFNKGNLVLSRGIKAGMRSMVEAINNAIQEKGTGSDQTEDETSGQDNSNDTIAGTIHPLAQKLFFQILGVTGTGRGEASDDPKFDNLKIFQMILPAMKRLVRQIELTFEHYALNFESEGVRRIFISGQITANKMALDFIGKQLDLPIEAMNPFPSNTPFTRHIRIPDSVNERESFVPAIGLALANNAITPNFLFTHQDKSAFEGVRRNNMRILTSCMIILMVLIGIFSWQERNLDSQRMHVEELQAKLFAYNPPAEKEMLLALYAKTKNKRQTLQKIVHRYAPAAVVAELSKTTPPAIRLINIDASFSSIKTKDKTTHTNTLSIDGIVFGDSASFEAVLTGYLLNLKNTPIFEKPNVQNKHIEFYQGQEVLRFKAKLDII